ncbi:hypothetical protein Dvina_07330 [Dactylosporangium vinaceum]|uniref:Secreted protein n=1 Tax=Dactylosporangium vinaceum TaxID=53362 RepID=A0ABV5M6N0_9ACTN|nr:hypothetical protein [Dactylosporangium vinaceum]UAB97915.1 hypothetical protein Dvina_07330 [Dactylosporangium vinaceum]
MTLRNAVIAFFLILAAVVVTKTGRDQTPRPVSGITGTLCSISPQRVTESSGKLLAAAQFHCDPPGPDRFALTVRLQHSTDAGWKSVAEQTFTAAKGETLRSVPAAQRSRQVSAACADGAYRTAAEWSVNGGRTGSALGPERRNPCR